MKIEIDRAALFAAVRRDIAGLQKGAMIHISVQPLAHTYRARVPGSKVVATCTDSPELAAKRAAVKVFGRGRPFRLACQQEPNVLSGVLGRYTATAKEL
jgi:hypothetical protein